MLYVSLLNGSKHSQGGELLYAVVAPVGLSTDIVWSPLVCCNISVLS